MMLLSCNVVGPVLVANSNKVCNIANVSHLHISKGEAAVKSTELCHTSQQLYIESRTIQLLWVTQKELKCHRAL